VIVFNKSRIEPFCYIDLNPEPVQTESGSPPRDLNDRPEWGGGIFVGSGPLSRRTIKGKLDT
jgi:hypothetical protein